jgi:hypothetical protein
LHAVFFVVLAGGCAFEFKPSIEPLVFPTLAPQPFNEPTRSTEQPDEPEPPTQQIQPLDDDFNRLPSLRGIDLAGFPGVLIAGGFLGALASLYFAFSPLKLPGTDRVCTGSVIAGILGFVSLMPMDFAVAWTMAELAATGPIGILLDAIVLLPVELVVLDLHVGFASLAYHASANRCDELTPRDYFVPPWGLSP